MSDPFARYQQAERRQWAEMIQNSKTYFNPWETIYEGNPQLILERREPVTLPPLYILQGELDDNVLPAVQEKFAATYRAAGGECELEIFKAASTAGSPTRAHKPTVPTKESRPSSRASSARGVWRHRLPFARA